MSALKEVLPKFGLVYSDRGNLAEIMSKPKLIPVKVGATMRAVCMMCVTLSCRALTSKS